MSKEIGLRAKKAARVKLSILEQTLFLIGTKSFRDLHVNEICERVEISRVTFFKYFRKKEDILAYFMKVWCLEREIELGKSGKTGLAAIRYLFENAGQTSSKNPGIMLSLIGYIANLTVPPTELIITRAERLLLFPQKKDLEKIKIPSIGQMFSRHLKEARVSEEIKSQFPLNSTVDLLATVFYGSGLIAHAKQTRDIKNQYMKNLELVLKILTS
jgi:AcrR family transcriptional regulator